MRKLSLLASLSFLACCLPNLSLKFSVLERWCNVSLSFVGVRPCSYNNDWWFCTNIVPYEIISGKRNAWHSLTYQKCVAIKIIKTRKHFWASAAQKNVICIVFCSCLFSNFRGQTFGFLFCGCIKWRWGHVPFCHQNTVHGTIRVFHFWEGLSFFSHLVSQG